MLVEPSLNTTTESFGLSSPTSCTRRERSPEGCWPKRNPRTANRRREASSCLPPASFSDRLSRRAAPSTLTSRAGSAACPADADVRRALPVGAAGAGCSRRATLSSDDTSPLPNNRSLTSPRYGSSGRRSTLANLLSTVRCSGCAVPLALMPMAPCFCQRAEKSTSSGAPRCGDSGPVTRRIPSRVSAPGSLGCRSSKVTRPSSMRTEATDTCHSGPSGAGAGFCAATREASRAAGRSCPLLTVDRADAGCALPDSAGAAPPASAARSMMPSLPRTTRTSGFVSVTGPTATVRAARSTLVSDTSSLPRLTDGCFCPVGAPARDRMSPDTCAAPLRSTRPGASGADREISISPCTPVAPASSDRGRAWAT